jgi:hypothetical protein
MTTTPTSTAIALAEPVFSNAERLALAGFLAGYTGGYALDLRQYASWCQQRHLRLFQALRRALRRWHPRRAGSVAAQLRQEVFALTGTQAADAAPGVDRGALHDRSGAGLADARQRADDLGDFRLAGQVIIAAQHIGEREGACFQAGQQRGPVGARLTSLLQRSLALLGG